MPTLEPTQESPLHAPKDVHVVAPGQVLELPAKAPTPGVALERLALSGRWRLEQTPESCRAYTLALEGLVTWAIRVDTVGVH